MMKKLEKIFSGIAALIIWVVLYLKGSGPVFSDELLYVDIGLNNYQVPSYANRYFHVYLQKLFMWLAPTPLDGTRIFWGFLVALTALLVYWNARSMFRHSRPLHGLLAVGFFFSYQFISKYCGVTSADITAMWIVTVFLSIYLFHLRSGRIHRWPLVALGALSFLSFKTKETTLFANIFLLGLLFDQDGKFDLRKIPSLIKPFLIGLFSAVGLFILLDAVFLKYPFFSINPRTLAAVFENYAYTGGFREEPSSYFTTFLLADIMVPFLLFLVSGVVQYGREESRSLKIIWLFPVLLAFFMTINMLKIPWGFIERFYFPALPVIAILAPQWLRLEPPRTVRERIGMAVLATAAIALAIFMHFSLQNYADSIQLGYGKFYESIYQPLLLLILLGFILIARKMNWVNIVLPLFCIIALLIVPLLFNQKYIFRVPWTGNFFNQYYGPFLNFREQLHPVDGMSFFISNGVSSDYQALSNDVYELSAMYNVFFNARTSQKNFKVGFEPDKIGSMLLTRKFDYALLTTEDWQRILNDPLMSADINERYKASTAAGTGWVLLETQ
jgi:hypothetical protein